MSIGPEVIRDHWRRAVRALGTARATLPYDRDATANRAYYSAFYAVSARFMLEGKTFRSHSGVERAVHRDLVHTKKWPVEIGDAYKDLHRLRMVGDYGSLAHVSNEHAEEAIRNAECILRVLSNEYPDIFELPGETTGTDSE